MCMLMFKSISRGQNQVIPLNLQRNQYAENHHVVKVSDILIQTAQKKKCHWKPAVPT